VTKLYFAHLTDVHISENDSWGTVGKDALTVFRDTIHAINTLEALDFVLITGDLLDKASDTEIEAVQNALAQLEKPWHFTPGNHDGFIDPAQPDALTPDEAVHAIDRRIDGHAQKSYWSRTIKPGIQLIGLDSRYADHWNGQIVERQQEWLRSQLEAHRDDLVLVAVHHPLHNLGTYNEELPFSNFIVDQGPEIEAILDKYPNAKMVLAGHHHASQIRPHNGRIHINTAALTGYPCQYRLIHMERTSSGWETHVETHTAADDRMLKRARKVALESSIAKWYDENNREAWVRLCAGTPDDHSFDGVL